MKLDPSAFRYITKDEFRVLTAVEMGMRNHELVPTPLIESIAKITRGGTFKMLQTLLRHKLVAHDGKKYDGYRLTYHGFDFLALRALVARGTITGVGRRIGVGKESDVHCAQGPNGEVYALKLHRLGRISFRNIKEKRDYLQHRTHGSWMYMARLAAAKEFSYMKALKDEGFPVPSPIDQNRHVVLMSFIDAVPMYRLLEFKRPEAVLERLMRLLVRLGRAGIVHGDFNEFNLMIDRDEKATLIDFPQMIHLNHLNARETFDRDVLSIREFFRKRMNIEVEKWPIFDEVLAEAERDGNGVLANVKVDGVSEKENALLISAHEGPAGARGGIDNDTQCRLEEDDEEDSQAGSEDEESEDEEEEDGKKEGFEGLVPADGRDALGAAEEEEGEDAEEACAVSNGKGAGRGGGYPVADAATAVEIAEGKKEREGEDEESGSDSDEEDDDAPVGAVTIASGRKTRKRQTAKEARKNLQRQQQSKPAKANCSKNKSMRQARSAIKEYS